MIPDAWTCSQMCPPASQHRGAAVIGHRVRVTARHSGLSGYGPPNIALRRTGAGKDWLQSKHLSRSGFFHTRDPGFSHIQPHLTPLPSQNVARSGLFMQDEKIVGV